MTKSTIRRFADLVDLADSGETEGRIGNERSVWRLVEVENAPGMFVFSNPTTSWCYEIDRLRTDERQRTAIKRTAEMRRRVNAE